MTLSVSHALKGSVLRSELTSNDCAQRPPKIERCGRFWVLRDDLIVGGTKRRILDNVLPKIHCRQIIYAAHPYGHGALALAESCKATEKDLVLLFPCNSQGTGIFELVSDKSVYPNVEIIQNSKVKNQHELFKIAKNQSIVDNSFLIPVGFDFPEFKSAIIQLARNLNIPRSNVNESHTPNEIWVLAGSGTMARALGEAWPSAQIMAVNLGLSHVNLTGIPVENIYNAFESPEQAALDPPEYPSCKFYDAKVWRFAKKLGSDGALIWNIA